MATSQDHAFLRYAVGAGFMPQPMAQLCLRALDAAVANGRAVSAAELAVELGLIEPGAARTALDALRAAGSPTPLAQLLAPASSPRPVPAQPAALPPAPAALPPSPARPPAGAPPPRPPLPSLVDQLRAATPPPQQQPFMGLDAGQTLISDEVMPVPGDPPEDFASRTLMLDAVLPLPPQGAGAPPDVPVAPSAEAPRDGGVKLQAFAEDDGPDMDDLGGVTLMMTAVIAPPGMTPVEPQRPPPPMVGERKPPAGPAAAPEVVGETTREVALRDVMQQAAQYVESGAAPSEAAAAPPGQAPERPAGQRPPRTQTRADPTAPLPPREAPTGAGGWLIGGILVVAALLGVLATGALRPPPRPDPAAAAATELPPPPVEGLAAPALPPQPPPPRTIPPEELLAAWEAELTRLITAEKFPEARQLEGTLPPEVMTDPDRRGRAESARRALEQAQHIAAGRVRQPLTDLVQAGDVALARRTVEEATARLGPAAAVLAKDLEDLVKERHATLAALRYPAALDAEKLEQQVRARLAVKGVDLLFFPNGGLALDYALAPEALGDHLRLESGPDGAGLRLKAEPTQSVMAVHGVNFLQVTEVSVDFSLLEPASPEASYVALMVGVRPDAEKLIGAGWNGEAVQYLRAGRFVRVNKEARFPLAVGPTYRLRLAVNVGAAGTSTRGVIEERPPREGASRAGGLRMWADRRDTRGSVAIYARGVDLRVSSLQVRGLVDAARP